MAARAYTRPKLKQLLGTDFKEVDVESLGWLLFEIVYPTPSRMAMEVDEYGDLGVE